MARVGFQENPGYDTLTERTSWLQPSGEFFQLACCDCGLVHEVHVRTPSGEPVTLRFKRLPGPAQSLRRKRRMKPEHYAQATQLETQHRVLQQELKAWQGQHEPSHLLGEARSGSAGVPAAAWNTVRRDCITHVQAAIAANRKTFEAL